MRTSNSTLDHTAPSSLAALATQLRDGPLQELLALQIKTTQLAEQLADSPAGRIEDLEGLVLRELTDAHRSPH